MWTILYINRLTLYQSHDILCDSEGRKKPDAARREDMEEKKMMYETGFGGTPLTFSRFWEMYSNDGYDAVIITDEHGNVDNFDTLTEAFRCYGDADLIVESYTENDVEGEDYTLEVTLCRLYESDFCEPDSYRSLCLCAEDFH